MKGTESEQRRIAELQRRVSELEHEAATYKAENAALRLGQPDAVREFAKQIAHDFNNVLQSIIGKADLVLDEASDQDEAKALVQMISDAAVRGARVTRQLLEFGTTGELPDRAIARPKPTAVARRKIRPPVLAATPGRILLAEDQEVNRDLARRVLEKAGHQVIVVANGAEAVAAAQDADFDLVLMDMQMPVMDGLTATRKIRQLAGPRSRVPIIAVPGAILPENIESFTDAGVDDYIAKPFKFSALVGKIDSWLDRSVRRDGAEAATGNKAGGTSLAELDGLMGRAWVERGLSKLVAQIDDLFSNEVIASPDFERLAAGAHALVSLAGLLGFANFSQCCSALEEAAKSKRNVALRLVEAKTAAAQARGQAIEMLDSR